MSIVKNTKKRTSTELKMTENIPKKFTEIKQSHEQNFMEKLRVKIRLKNDRKKN